MVVELETRVLVRTFWTTGLALGYGSVIKTKYVLIPEYMVLEPRRSNMCDHVCGRTKLYKV